MTSDESPDETRERHVPEGCKVSAKVKRGTGTRDQDTLKIEARGETAEEAAERFQWLLSQAQESEWDESLRALQPDEDGGIDE